MQIWLSLAYALVVTTAVAISSYPFSQNKRPGHALPMVLAVGVGVFLAIWSLGASPWLWEGVAKVSALGFLLGTLLNCWAHSTFLPGIFALGPQIALDLHRALESIGCASEWTPSNTRLQLLERCAQLQRDNLLSLAMLVGALIASFVISRVVLKRHKDSIA